MTRQGGNGAAASEMGQVSFRAFGGRRIRVLAHGGHSQKSLTLGEHFIYWTDEEDGTMTRLSKDGGVPLIIASGLDRPGMLTLSNGFLYWTHQRHEQRGAIVRMPVEGGPWEVIVSGQEIPQAVAAHEGTVAWTNLNDCTDGGTVCMKKPGDDSIVTLATGQKRPYTIVMDAHHVYWGNMGLKRPTYFRDGSIVCKPHNEKQPIVIAADQPMPVSLVMDQDWIYWVFAHTFNDPMVPGAIRKRHKSGGELTDIAEWYGLDKALLALDATYVYCLQTWSSQLYRVPKQGGDLEKLMDVGDDVDSRIGVDSFAVDDRFIYWAAYDSQRAGGAVFKMAK